MKKPYPYHKKSKIVCAVPGCNRLIKMNVAERKHKHLIICFKHWLIEQMHIPGKSGKFIEKAKRELKTV